MAVGESVAYCSGLCTTIDVDVTAACLPDLAGFDAVVVSTMPGTFRNVLYPAQDLRESQQILDLIRQADALGLTLFTGCSGLLVFADAGILEGHTVVSHPTLLSTCRTIAGVCIPGGQYQLPISDENLITGTSGRYFAQEIPEIIARNLDANAVSDKASDDLVARDLDVIKSPIDLGGPAIEGWAIGGPLSDGVMDLCAFEDGFVAVGYTFSAPDGTADLLALRFNDTGNVVWSRAIGGRGRDYGQEVCVTADGGLAVVGYTTSLGAGLEDIWLVKLTADGDVEWMKTYGGEAPDAGYGIVATDDGGFAICGYTTPEVGMLSDLTVLRVDADGCEAWSKSITGRALERGHAIAIGSAGILFVTGGTTSRGAGNYDALLAAISPEGEILWEQTYGYGQFDVGLDLILSASGGVILTGYGDQESVDGNDVRIAWFSDEGRRLRTGNYGESRSFDYGEGALELENGDVLICGARTGTMTTSNDAWLLRVSSTARVIWEAALGDSSENEWATSICRLASGKVVVAGHTLSAGAGMHDVMLLFIDPDWKP
jgi:hypothetical protein